MKERVKNESRSGKNKDNIINDSTDKVIQVDRIPTAEELEKEINRQKSTSDYIKVIISTVSGLVVVAAIAVLIATFVLPVLRVTGNSMTPTLENGTVVVCKKTTKLERGDVIAFYYNNKLLLKRIIGLPGDVIDMKADGTVYLNGELLEEDYIDSPSYGENDLTYPYQVPEDRYFVMGDHRATSVDSRSKTIGCVSEEVILGKVKVSVWPIKKIKWLDK